MPNNKNAQKALERKDLGYAKALKALPKADWQWCASDYANDEPIYRHHQDYAFWSCDTPIGGLTCNLKQGKWKLTLDRYNWGSLSATKMNSALRAKMLELQRQLGDD